MKVAPTISGNLERLTEDRVNLDEYLKELLNKPLIFTIKVSKFISPSQPDKPSSNKLIDYINFCPAQVYFSWCQELMNPERIVSSMSPILITCSPVIGIINYHSFYIVITPVSF
uniref:Uncharacterized protein n=2 Tax=Strongyloides papillosus TaxID=174720 RepID=A0A0N5C3I7_STREA